MIQGPRGVGTDPAEMVPGLRKELLVGLLLGGSLGLVLATIGYLWTGDTGIALTVGLSIVGIVLWANLIGSTLPLLCTWVGIESRPHKQPLLSPCTTSRAHIECL